MDLSTITFEKFVGFGSKTSRKISVTRHYSFGLPPSFCIENGINDFSHVEIYYNSQEKIIALHFLKEKNDACFALIKYGKGNKQGAAFAAKSFFNRYNIDPKNVYGKYDPTKIHREEVGDLFVIKLEEHGPQTPVVPGSVRVTA